MNPEIEKLISQLTSEIKEVFSSFVQMKQAILDAIDPEFLKNLLDSGFLEDLKNLAEKWPQEAAVKYGWFTNWFTPFDVIAASLKGGKECLDIFMISHLEESWDEITEKLISLCAERKHIFDIAFKLHKEGNYIACIPLFLSQTDGICAQYLGAYLFSEHERRKNTIQDAIEKAGDKFVDVFLLHVLNTKTQFGANISHASITEKEIAPNRNGILHGSGSHLDYGTKINSMKCFSLLAFITYCLADKGVGKLGRM